MNRERIRLCKAKTGTGYNVFLPDGRMFFTRLEYFQKFVDGEDESVSFIELPPREDETSEGED